MQHYTVNCCRAVVFLVSISLATPASAQQPAPIPDGKIKAVQSQLSEAMEIASAARQKLALRRVVREAESVLAAYRDAPNRFEVLHVLFRTHQKIFKEQSSEANREAILDTCRLLAHAPDEYADIRWDADLLLSQTQIAKQGGNARKRAEGMRNLVDRYLGTSGEKKVIRVVLVMAVEAGDLRLVEYLDSVICERFGDDLAMIAFKRDTLPSRVFGVTFFADLRDTSGNILKFPMNQFGTTTAFLFWSDDENGRANLKEISEVLGKQEPNSQRRLEIFSVNLDELPDAGESILREHGLNLTALHLPGGRSSLIYKAYSRVDPKLVTVSPTGIASLFETGGNMDGKGFERWFGSSTARAWVDPYYCSKLQSLACAEFLILDSDGKFDPAVPPELKALSGDVTANQLQLKRNDKFVPEATIRAIQACFIAPPTRYHTSYEEVIAGYQKADKLCAQAIKAHPDAPDLWMIRNRRMVALMGLWKVKLDNQYIEEAAAEAQATLAADCPAGADAIARLCLARQAIRNPAADAKNVIDALAQPQEGVSPTAPALAVAALLAMEVGDRDTYSELRQAILKQYGDEPPLWPLTSFMLDPYHRYWLNQIPFVSGWIYAQREARGLGGFGAEQSIRRFESPLKTPDGETAELFDKNKNNWVLLRFIQPTQIARLSDSPDPFVASRPLQEISVFEVVLSDDTEVIHAELAKRNAPPYYPILCISDDVRNSLDRKFGMLHDGGRPAIVILRPDGFVALAASALSQQGIERYGNLTSTFFLQQDEAAVADALSKGDLNEAKRLAFTHAPAANTSLPREQLATEQLRARAKVYLAQGDWEAALVDVDLVYGRLLEQAGLMGMRTAELDEIEQLRDHILASSGQTNASP